MKKLALMWAAIVAGPAMAADTAVSTDQVTQRVISRSGGNVSSVVQEGGGGNSAESIQIGSGNRAIITQQGTGNTSAITQTGSGLAAETLQRGGAGVRIDQTGITGNIRVQQVGPGSGTAR